MRKCCDCKTAHLSDQMSCTLSKCIVSSKQCKGEAREQSYSVLSSAQMPYPTAMPESAGLDSARLQALTEWQHQMVADGKLPHSEVRSSRAARGSGRRAAPLLRRLLRRSAPALLVHLLRLLLLLLCLLLPLVLVLVLVIVVLLLLLLLHLRAQPALRLRLRLWLQLRLRLRAKSLRRLRRCSSRGAAKWCTASGQASRRRACRSATTAASGSTR